MWGMGGWSGSDDHESFDALDEAIALGCNFFDTALGLRRRPQRAAARRTLAAVTRHAALRRDQGAAEELPLARTRRDAARRRLPADHIRAYTEKSLENLGTSTIDLQQFHVWSDAWADDEGWKRAVEDLKAEADRGFGISVNRWEADQRAAGPRSGLVDAVQVVYNIFDQAPEDELFPYCQAHGIAIIARVPFDEGSLTGTLRADARGREGDWRNLYFTPGHIAETLPHVAPAGAARARRAGLPDLALRFILHHPAVTTVIPGMRRPAHVERNIGASDGDRCRLNCLPSSGGTGGTGDDWQVPSTACAAGRPRLQLNPARLRSLGARSLAIITFCRYAPRSSP